MGILLSKFVHIEDNDTEFVVRTLATELREGQIESFMQRLQSMFSSIPYEMEMGNERNLHNALFMLLYLLGIYVKTEYHTSAGRIDLFIKTEKFYYIIELKLNKSATEALQQIEDKKYALPFASDNQKIIKVGVNFSTSTRTISDWAIR